MLLPLCSADEVRDELAVLDRELTAMHERTPVCPERWAELRTKRLIRRDRLHAQLVEMETPCR